MQLKFYLEAIIGNLFIFLGIISTPCFCSTGEYDSHGNFLSFTAPLCFRNYFKNYDYTLPADQSE